MRDEGRADEVYEPDPSDVLDDAGILDSADTLEDPRVDPLDRGWSPPERPLAVERYGTTAAEGAEHQSMDVRLAQEEPDAVWPGPEADGDGIGDAPGTDGEPWDDEVGRARSGRLVAQDEGAHGVEDSSLFAQDVGIDGAAASAEEAAMHIVPAADLLEDDIPDASGRP